MIDLSVVIPAYNEADVLGTTLDDALAWLDGSGSCRSSQIRSRSAGLVVILRRYAYFWDKPQGWMFAHLHFAFNSFERNEPFRRTSVSPIPSDPI